MKNKHSVILVRFIPVSGLKHFKKLELDRPPKAKNEN